MRDMGRLTAMDWQDELRDIVDNARRVPTFPEWLAAGGYEQMPATLTSPLQMRSIMRTLYMRYCSEYRRAA